MDLMEVNKKYRGSDEDKIISYLKDISNRVIFTSNKFSYN